MKSIHPAVNTGNLKRNILFHWIMYIQMRHRHPFVIKRIVAHCTRWHLAAMDVIEKKHNTISPQGQVGPNLLDNTVFRSASIASLSGGKTSQGKVGD